MAYKIPDSGNKSTEGELIGGLTEEQKQELYESYEESHDESNLIELNELRAMHSLKMVRGEEAGIDTEKSYAQMGQLKIENVLIKNNLKPNEILT
jgi:hypothetical protein